MRTYNFHILMGLPGSGKSWWREHEFASGRGSIFEVYCYDFDLDDFNDLSLGDAVLAGLSYCDVTQDHKFPSYGMSRKRAEEVHVCIDGLILGKEQLKEVVKACRDYTKENDTKPYKTKFIVHHWKEDREKCLENDRIRVRLREREKSSETTIRTATLEEIFDQRYEVIEHKVPALDSYDIGFKPHEEYNMSGIMMSESWSGGGTGGDCWGNTWTIEPESNRDFEELTELLEKLCPQITLKQYRELEKECAELCWESEFGYYGGYEVKRFWKCDLRKLHKKLGELGLI